MVRGRADSFAKPHFANEAKFPIWNAKQRRASSLCFGVIPAVSDFMVNAPLTRISVSCDRRGSWLYARSALIASPLAEMIGGREYLLSCKIFCCPSGRRIKYSASAAADTRGSGRVCTEG
jgi:hypothetical protein